MFGLMVSEGFQSILRGGGQGRRMLEEELSAQQPELVGEAVHITVDQTRPKSTAGTRVSHFLW